MATDPGRCEVCGKPADLHTCEIRDGVKSEHHVCRAHAADVQIADTGPEVFIRQAIDLCRELTPASPQATAMIAAEIRRLTERALQQFDEDARAFAFS